MEIIDGVAKMRSMRSILSLEKMSQYLKDNGVKTMVEIGSYSGESSEVFANYFEKVYCVDPWQPFYDDNDPASDTDMIKVEELFDKVCKRHPNIIKMKMTSEEAFNQLKSDDIHFVYIDGNHQYLSVKKDVLMWFTVAELFLGGHDYHKTMFRSVYDAVNDVFLEKEITKYYDTSWTVELKNI